MVSEQDLVINTIFINAVMSILTFYTVISKLIYRTNLKIRLLSKLYVQNINHV